MRSFGRFLGRFITQLAFTFALVIIFYHLQQVWYNQSKPELGLWGAIRMQWNIAAPVIIPALIIVLLAGWLEYRAQQEQSKEYKALNDSLNKMRQEMKDGFENLRKDIKGLKDGGGKDDKPKPNSE